MDVYSNETANLVVPIFPKLLPEITERGLMWVAKATTILARLCDAAHRWLPLRSRPTSSAPRLKLTKRIMAPDSREDNSYLALLAS